MKIDLRPHLKIRLQQRKIPQNYPEIIIKDPEYNYFDTETHHFIATKELPYNGKLRSLAVSYDIIDSAIQVITIHPISGQEIKNKLSRKRWVKNEKN